MCFLEMHPCSKKRLQSQKSMTSMLDFLVVRLSMPFVNCGPWESWLTSVTVTILDAGERETSSGTCPLGGPMYHNHTQKMNLLNNTWMSFTVLLVNI